MEPSVSEPRQAGCAPAIEARGAARAQNYDAAPCDGVAAGLLSALFEATERLHGVDRRTLLEIAALAEPHLSDPNALLPARALYDTFRALLARTRDPGVGLGLAEALDLRRQGFWGYALLSCASLRERFELSARYQRLRSPHTLSFWHAGSVAALEYDPGALPPDLAPLMIDWSVALELLQLRAQLHVRPPAELWLTCAERPHHVRLRALLAGSIVFRAPYNRLQFSASVLETKLAGDPHLQQLAVAQLEQRLLERERPARPTDVVAQVQGRLRIKLASDSALPSIASELGLSARTLQRQLAECGTSFRQLLEEARCTRALDYLRATDQAVDQIALHVGYPDPANFRRAFRRWTGASPSAFRREQASVAPHPQTRRRSVRHAAAHQGRTSPF